jgi:fucose 4-O-acetylase-like acetyltransferase
MKQNSVKATSYLLLFTTAHSCHGHENKEDTVNELDTSYQAASLAPSTYLARILVYILNINFSLAYSITISNHVENMFLHNGTLMNAALHNDG